MASENNKGSGLSKIAYYSVVALSLAVIGAVSWFTVSRLGAINNITKSDTKKNNQSYSSDTSSYTDTTQQSVPQISEPKTEEAATTVSSEPYEQPKQEEKTVFTNPVEGAVIKPFSSTDLQYSETYKDMRIHEGTDIKCEEGTAVKAVFNGKITDVIDDETYGKTVIIEHTNGVRVKYCGLKTVAVIKDAEVKSGDQIGTSGTVPCESKDEPHIHIEAADESGLASVFALFGVGE